MPKFPAFDHLKRSDDPVPTGWNHKPIIGLGKGTQSGSDKIIINGSAGMNPALATLVSRDQTTPPIRYAWRVRALKAQAQKPSSRPSSHNQPGLAPSHATILGLGMQGVAFLRGAILSGHSYITVRVVASQAPTCLDLKLPKSTPPLVGSWL